MNKKHFFLITLITFLLIFKGFSQGKEVWKNYTNFQQISALLTVDDFLWQGSYGGIIKRDINSGKILNKYTVVDGLPSNRVIENSMSLDVHGNVWAGFWGNVAKFDGNNWISYISENDPLYSDLNQSISKVFARANGDIWILNQSGKVFTKDFTGWKKISDSSELNIGNVYSLIVDNKDNVWISSENGVFKYDGSAWVNFKNTGFNYANDIDFDSKNNIYFTRVGQGFFKFDGNNWVKQMENTGGFLYIDFKDQIWTINGCLLKLENNNWVKTIRDPSRDVPSDSIIGYKQMRIFGFAVDKNGAIWGNNNAQGHDLFKYKDNSWETFTRDSEDFFNKSNSSSKIIVNENNEPVVYFNYSNGSYYSSLKNNVWDSLNPSQVGEFIRFVQPKNSIKKYIQLRITNSIETFENGSWNQFAPLNNSFKINQIETVGIDLKGNKWIVSGEFLYKYDGVNWIKFDKTNSALTGNPIELFMDSKGTFWLNNGDIIKYDGQNWLNITKTKDSVLLINRILGIDSYDNLWVFTKWPSLSFGKYNGQKIDFFSCKEIINRDLQSSDFFDVYFFESDPFGNIWFCMNFNSDDAGLTKYDGKTWVNYNRRNSKIAEDIIYSFTIDSKGQKWIATKHSGISLLNDGSEAFFTYKPKLTGKIYFDKNKNNQKDPDENYVANHKVKVLSTDQIAFTDSQGEYVLPLDYGTYQIRYLAEGYWSAVKDSTYIVNLNDSITALPEIGVYAPDTIDLKRNISLGQNRCGFDVPMYYTYRNAGTVEIQGSIALKLDNEIKIQSSLPMYDSIQNNIAYYSINSLPAGVEKQITLNLKMPDFNRMGDKLSYTTQFFTKDNTFNDTLIRELRCAYDPNEKEVFTTSFTEKKYTDKKEVFSYTIRFQNVGNDTAINILVQDTLNNQFDLTSFNVVASSHIVNTTIDTNRVANFLFKNIQLPDSTTNEIKSHGFVTFTINRDNKIKELQPITNTANIYFDYNPAVITNTTYTNLVDTVMYEKIQVCKGASYVFADNERLDSIVKSENHVIVDTVNNQIRLKNILVSPFPEINIQKEVHICQGDSLQFGKQLLKTEGEYTEVFQSLKGCDSTVILKLKIDSLITTLSMIDDSQANKGFESNEKNATSYQWINCNENKNIEGETQKVYYPKQQGEYAILLKRNECVDTSDCLDFKLSSLSSNNAQSKIECYPNPTNDVFFVTSEPGDFELQITDIQGREVYNYSSKFTSKEKISIDVKDLPTSIYFVKTILNKIEKITKLEVTH